MSEIEILQLALIIYIALVVTIIGFRQIGDKFKDE